MAIKTITDQAESHIIRFASAIGTSPQSFRQWHCLYIDLSRLDAALYQECLFWTHSILDTHFSSIEGDIYFCDEGGIHIFCKSINPNLLQDAGEHIADMIKSETQKDILYTLYDLYRDGFSYTHLIYGENDTLFSHAMEAPRYDVNSAFAAIDHPTVLLVEDDRVTSWMVQNTLADFCNFMHLVNGERLFSLYDSIQPDFIFLDINLPDHNGYDLLDWIRLQDPDVPVVMLSGQNNLGSIARTILAGATGFISKPFIKDDLLSYICPPQIKKSQNQTEEHACSH